MNAIVFIGNIKMSYLRIFSWGAVVSLLLVNQTMVYAQEEHEHHQHQLQQQTQHQENHEHHIAATETKGYVSTEAYYTIPEVMLIESDGSQKLLSETFDSNKPVMLNFIFTTCTAICPTMSATFAQVASQMDAGGEIMQLVSISVDPEHDTPEKLTEYAKQFKAGPQWRLFTGTANNSILAQRAFDAYRGDKMNHLPLFFIHAPGSDKWARVEGLASADELVMEYRMLAGK